MSLEAGAVFFFKDKDWAQFGLGSVRKIHRDKNKEVEIQLGLYQKFPLRNLSNSDAGIR